MKTMMMTFAFCLSTVSSYAAEIREARYNSENRSIELEVLYVGGCEKHTFDLRLSGSCLETHPVSCNMILQHDSNNVDMCEALISKTINFSLADVGLDTPYYKGAFLTILGDRDSKGSIALPYCQRTLNKAKHCQEISCESFGCVVSQTKCFMEALEQDGLRQDEDYIVKLVNGHPTEVTCN